MISIEEINDNKRFADLEYAWKNIFDAVNLNSIFSSFEWCYCWWKYYGQNKKLKILLLKENNELVGIFPLMEEKCKFNYHPIKSIRFIGDGLADRIQFLFLQDKTKCMTEIMNYLSRQPNWQLGQLNEIDGSYNIESDMDSCLSTNITVLIKKGSSCPFMSLGDNFNGWVHKLDKKMRKSIRNRERKMLSDGLVETKEIRSHPDILGIMQNAAALESKSWKGREKKGIFQTENDIRFHAELASKIMNRDWLQMFFLSFNRQDISYQYGFRLHNCYYAYNTAYDPEYSEYSPGTQVRYKHVESMMKHTVRNYDFLRGDEQFKLHWPVHIRYNKNIILYRDNIYTKYLKYLEEDVKPIIKKCLFK